jgi:CRISPR-associated protein Cmr1
MKTLAYTLTFVTPAFLGDAEQHGRWRTPPIKALLRQWWRVVYDADHGFAVDVDAMRREEGLLFGNAWLENDFRKSLVRLRLDRWEVGRETKQNWGRQEIDRNKAGVDHPEVGKIGPKLYLGYGPLVVEKVQRQGKKPEYATVLKNNTAIQAGEHATLSLAMPDEDAPRIQRALWLMDRYGTLGGRSRNGWGSFALTPINETPQLDGQVPLRDWKECLSTDWPHAIGRDDKGPLIWQTSPRNDWKAVMRELAIVKIGLRTQFVFPNAAPPHHQPLERHWLSYPITRHTTRAFDRNARLPNSLRFKVRPAPEEPKKLVGVIFHMPCLPPPEFNPDCSAIQRTWESVHALLDELGKPSGDRGYGAISDKNRRNSLKQGLDNVRLVR